MAICTCSSCINLNQDLTHRHSCLGLLQEKTVDKDKKSAKQRLILGTHTSEGEQNYLMIAEVALPTSDSEAEAAQYDEERGEVGGFGAATGRVQVRTTQL